MRHGFAFVLLAGALLFGCGSDGGSSSSTGIEAQVQYLNVGDIRGDVPTILHVTVAKPFHPAAAVELMEVPTGAFQPGDGILPMSAPSGHEASLWVTFTPPAAPADSTQEGAIRLLFRRLSGGEAVPVTVHFRAEIETPTVRILQTEVAAGDVIVGESREFGVYIENTSKVTPITVTDVTPPDGSFSMAPDAFGLPAPVGPGSRFLVRLQYTPQNLGSEYSSIQVFHSAAAVPFEATLVGTGVEKPSARLLETEVSAGNVVVGEEVECCVDFENTSTATPVTVTDVTLPDGEFSLAPDLALPATVAPGATLHLPLLYAPQGEGDASALVQIHHSADPVPLEATVTGTGIPPRLYFDFDVSLDWWTFESDWVTVDVPAEGVSLFIEATGDAGLIDLIELKGPGDVVYENVPGDKEAEFGSGPLNWMSYYPAGGLGYLNVEVPNTDTPEVQLVPGGGTYSFRLRDWWGWTSTLKVRVTVSQRTGGAVQEGTLDLRVFLADGLGIYFDPMGDAKLAETIRTIDAIFGMNGIRLGNVSFTVMSSDFDTLDAWWTEYMFASCTEGYSEGALNLFFVADMTTYYGVLGVAGAAPGPAANGTPFSGVAIDFNAADDGITVGATAAHEIGHYLGHFDMGGEGWLLTSEEAYAVLRHPLVNPGLPLAFYSPPESTDESQILAAIDLMPAMDIWCGTCTRWPAR